MKSLIIAVSPPFVQDYISRIEASPLGYRLAKGAFWSLVGTSISRGLGLLSSIMVARMLGVKGFGELGVVQSTAGLFGAFAGFGLGLTATKYVAEFRIANPAKTGRIISLSSSIAVVSAALVSILLIFLAPWLAAKPLAAPRLSGLIQIGAGLLFFNAVNGAQTGALSGFEAFKTIAKVNVLAGVATFPLMIGGAYLAGVKGAVWGSVLSLGLNCLLNNWALRREAYFAKIPLSYTKCLKEWRVLWKFSFPAFLSGIVTAPLGWAFSVILVNQPNGYVEMGIFSAANQWRMVLAFLPGMITNALLPVLSNEYRSNPHNYNNALSSSHKLILILILPLSLLLMVSSGLIMTLYGHGFKDGRTALLYILAGTGVSCIGSPAGVAIQSQGKMWLGCGMNSSYAIMCAALSYFLAPLYGASGCALSIYISYIFLTLWGYIYLYKQLPKGMFSRTLWGITLMLLMSIAISIF